MPRPITLCTGQWADLSLEVLAIKCRQWGFDGLELACWGDHFEVDKAMADPTYCEKKRALLDKYQMKVFAISNHLVGQVCCHLPIKRQSLLLDARSPQRCFFLTKTLPG